MTSATFSASPAHDVSEAHPGNKPSSSTSGSKKPQRPHRRITPKDRATFLKVLAAGWSFAKAAEATGHTDRAWRQVRQRDEEFALACHDAREVGVDKLEDVLREVAYDGNVTALIFALKNMRPAVWRDRHEVTHQIPAGDVQRLLAQLGEHVPADRREQFLAELEALSGGGT